ncbi:hypothetical protein T484DRAFT_1757668 [Baffinella frigidus]|nr:hypothetical protein T484DRAFT_1757668 [Cryptophyta sp. CCMP2293]
MEMIDRLEVLMKGMQSGHVDEVEQAMLDQLAHALKNCKATISTRARSDGTAGNANKDLSARRHFDRTRHASCPCVSVSSPPMLEFKALTVLAPDFDWLNDREGFEEQEEPAAKKKVAKPNRRRSWAESTAGLARLLHFPRKIVSGRKLSSGDACA